LALVALMYGFSRLPKVDGIIITTAGVLGILGFGYWENRSKSPILDLSIFRGNKTFVFSNLASLVNYSSTGAIGFLLSLYLQYIKGFSADKAGLVLIAQPIVMTLVSPFAGRLSDKIEPRIVASIGMSLTCIGLLSFAFLTNDSSVIQIVIALVVVGAGFGMFTSPNTNAIMSSVKPKHFAVAASITSTMRTIGQTLSTGITMIIFAVVIGPVVISQAYYPAFLTSAKIGFAIFAALCFAGIFASLARGSKETAAGKRPEVQK
jgi:MFS family permease